MAARLLHIRVTSTSHTTRPLLLRGLSTDISYPQYIPRVGENEEIKRKRLIYQSRKRGMSENGILLSSFADKYLNSLNSIQLEQYDKLINEPSNDWDIYQWITKKEEAPSSYQTPILKMIQKHVHNNSQRLTCQQPPLYTTDTK